MEQNNTECQSPTDSPILCVNNCGFFGTTTTMNMCSKCHKDFISHQEKAKLTASSITSMVTGGSGTSGSEPNCPTTLRISATQACGASAPNENGEPPKCSNRCSTCRKRVGLTGFNCRCGNTFCSVHRYSDKHECPFDYRTAAKDAIASANPVVKAHKLDKI